MAGSARLVHQVAREALEGPFKARGYKRTKKAGPGPSWERPVDEGDLLFGVHAGPYTDLLGGKFQADFECGEYLGLGALLAWCTEEQRAEWLSLALGIYNRGLGLAPGSSADQALQQDRREFFTEHLPPWDDPDLDALGWPWFESDDLPALFDFILRVHEEAEARFVDAVRRG